MRRASKLLLLTFSALFLSACFHQKEGAWIDLRPAEPTTAVIPTATVTPTMDDADRDISADVDAMETELNDLDGEFREIEQELNF